MNQLQDLLTQRVQTSVIPAKEFKPLDGRRALIGGTTILLAEEALDDCIEIAGLTKAVSTNLDSKLTPGAALQLQRTIFSKLGEKGGNLVVATDGKEIIRILEETKRQQSLPPEMFVSVVEGLLARYDHLQLDQVILSGGGTKAAIQIRSNTDIEIGIPGEALQTGRQLNWDMFGGVSVLEYMLRLICTNGMVGWRAGQILHELTRKDNATKWYNELFREMDIAGIQEAARSAILSAQETRLSVREFRALNTIIQGYQGDEGHFGSFSDRNWINKYGDRDLYEIPAPLAANLETPVNAWEALNVVTDLASHYRAASVEGSQRNLDQIAAGRMLRGKWDAGNWKPTWAPSFN